MVGERLLLVDDDVDIVNLTKSILSEEGYQIDEVYDGESAIPLVEPERYSLVLLDFVLPGIKGDTVAEKIRDLTRSYQSSYSQGTSRASPTKRC